MPIDQRFKVTGGSGLKRDVRPWTVRIVGWLKKTDSFVMVTALFGIFLLWAAPTPRSLAEGAMDFRTLWSFSDLILLFAILYFRWFRKQPVELPLKLPMHAKGLKDKNNPDPGKGGAGKAEGILFLGNVKDGSNKDDEVWLTNSDARTHILFLGTTGAGKSEGLKSLVTNALCWSSGFVYVDGKAQNTLWGDVYSLARRFGRDDDVLVLNYMTGNSDAGSRSNSLNPFSIGSASYLTQMMSGLMDDAGGDNAMWKGRAISLMSALLPALTWKRDNQGLLLDVGVIRDNLTMQQIIKMSRDPALPDRIIRGLQSYLDTLPGYVDSAFDDEGNERPPTPNEAQVDLSQTRQQHGYLTMQFTRSLSSLADEYGYIFKQQLADIDMVDVVLNRRILVVLIPALEKSPDEAANLGKIVVAALKGMMGATLGAELEGEQSRIIDNNPTTASTPFMTVFDEVGYYTSPGMGVMAAQARSLGFCLIFAGQDMPSLQMRVKEEALSITGNCNLKIFGKLEDPTETKDFFEKTVSSALVSEVSGFSSQAGMGGGKSYYEGDNITFQARKEAGYDDLKRQGAGQVHFLWAEKVIAANMFYSNPKRVDVVRVQRFLGVSPRNWSVEARDKAVNDVIAHLRDQDWRAGNGAPALSTQEISWMVDAYSRGREAKQDGLVCGKLGVAAIMAHASDAVSAPGLAAPGATPGYWPLGAAGGSAPPPPGQPIQPGSTTPPWMTGAPGGSPGAMVTPHHAAPGPAPGAPAQPWSGNLPAASPPPWAGGGQPNRVAVPPAGAYAAPPGVPTTPPPWAGGAPAGAYAAPPQSAPPPWAAQSPVTPPRPPVPPPGQSPLYGAPAQPYSQPPPYAQPVPPQGGATWGGVMGGAPGMGVPPGGAQMRQAAPVAPPPPWMTPPQGGAMPPVVGTPPYAPPPYAAPMAGAPGGFVPPPAAPVSAPAAPPAAPPIPDNPEEVDAIMRGAAENLAGEMFFGDEPAPEGAPEMPPEDEGEKR